MSMLTFVFTNTHAPRYLWDHRNSSLTDFLINEYILGKNGMASPYVDGFYIGSCNLRCVRCKTWAGAAKLAVAPAKVSVQ
jgi:hypothetical protein